MIELLHLMETRQGRKLPLAPLPALPANVWGVILREATWVPHILDPDSIVGFCQPFSRASARRQFQVSKTSLLTKRRVVQVCKQWNTLATPYLYENLIIKRCRTIMSLYETLWGLRRTTNVNSIVTDTAYPLGGWTKRFDIAMQDVGGDADDEFVYLAEIIRRLPNLNIITFRITARPYIPLTLPHYFLPNLSRSSGPNLQAILWLNYIAIPNIHDWCAFLGRGMWNITTAYCPVIVNQEGLLPTMPAMRTFHIPRLMMNTILNSGPIMPFLRHAIFQSDRSGSEKNSAAWKLILRTCGQNVEVVQVEFQASIRIPNVLEIVSQTCPNLRRLNISIEAWSDLSLVPSLPGTVQVFGIYCSQVQARKRIVKSIFDVLTSKIEFGADLKAIQFLCRGTAIELCKNHRREVLKGMQALKNREVEIQDHEGRGLGYRLTAEQSP